MERLYRVYKGCSEGIIRVYGSCPEGLEDTVSSRYHLYIELYRGTLYGHTCGPLRPSMHP